MAQAHANAQAIASTQPEIQATTSAQAEAVTKAQVEADAKAAEDPAGGGISEAANLE